MKLNFKAKLMGSYAMMIALSALIGIAAWVNLRLVQTSVSETATGFNIAAATSAMQRVTMFYNDAATEYALGETYNADELKNEYDNYKAELESAHVALTANADAAAQTWVGITHQKMTVYLQAGDAMLASRNAEFTTKAAFDENALALKTARRVFRDELKKIDEFDLHIQAIQIGYLEKEYLYQYRDADHLKELNEEIKALRANVKSSASSQPTILQMLDDYSNTLEVQANILTEWQNQSEATLQGMLAFDQSREDFIDTLQSLNTLETSLVNENQNRADQAAQSALIMIVVVTGIVALAGAGFGYFQSSSISIAAGQMVRVADAISRGELNQVITVNSRDEMGDLAVSFRLMIAYMQSMASAASCLAQGDLTVNVAPQSAKDELGNAFAQMISNLRINLGLVADSANAVTAAASQLATASVQSGEAANQIATTIQHVALGNAQQTAGVTKTSGSVEQMGRVIDGVAKGAQEQAKAISQASQITSRINTAIGQVASNVQSVTRDSAQSASLSRDGAKTVKETINGMETIRSKVGLSASKVEEMGSHSEKIGDIVETIDDIASQTNLLALNAAIEAARANGAGAKVSEHLIQQHLLSVSNLLAELCLRGNQPLQAADLVELAKRAHVDTLNITDADGVVSLSNDPTSVGFRFPEDPKQQASVFRSLLKEKDGAIAQPAQARSQDGILYIYVGVSRRDQPGVVQAGMPADVIEKSGNYTRGFAVVADEVRKLAERSSLATKEIAALIKGIQKTVSEAVTAMKASAEEVEAGVSRAHSAGEVLDNILSAAESVYKQAEDAGAAAAKVSAAATELVEAVDTVSAVIEENTAATEEMAANSSELTQAIENIASVSEENSAAVEEVSASTEEVSAQVEEVSASAASLMEMAHRLQEVVAHFKIDLETKEEEIKMLQKVKESHISWRRRAEAMLAGTEQIALDSVPSHTQCALGHWYYGWGGKKYGQNILFKKLEPPHRDFHKLLREMVDMYSRDKKDTNKLWPQIERLSNEIINLLDKFEAEISNSQS